MDVHDVAELPTSWHLVFDLRRAAWWVQLLDVHALVGLPISHTLYSAFSMLFSAMVQESPADQDGSCSSA